jgi:hypothetical protein
LVDCAWGIKVWGSLAGVSCELLKSNGAAAKFDGLYLGDEVWGY